MPGVNLGTGFWAGGGPTLAFTGTFAGRVTVTVFTWLTTLVLLTWLTTLVPLTWLRPSLLTRPAMLAPFTPATLVLLILAPLTRPATLALTRPATFGWMVGMRGAMLRLG